MKSKLVAIAALSAVLAGAAFAAAKPPVGAPAPAAAVKAAANNPCVDPGDFTAPADGAVLGVKEIDAAVKGFNEYATKVVAYKDCVNAELAKRSTRLDELRNEHNALNASREALKAEADAVIAKAGERSKQIGAANEAFCKKNPKSCKK